MPSRKSHQQQLAHEIEVRRHKVAELRMGGMRNQRAIARELGVSPSTVNDDFAAINAQWAEEHREQVDEEKRLDLARLERLLRPLWAKALKGDTAAAKASLDILDRRAKILGYTAPSQAILSGPDGGPIQHQIDYGEMVAFFAREEGIDPADARAEFDAMLVEGLTL